MGVIEDEPQSGHFSVKRRDDIFAEKLKTRIWQEIPSDSNPYLAKACLCHGYELFDLMQNCRYSEVLYLLFRGELPDKDESKLLEQLQIALINPGLRHPATHSAVYAGVGKSDPAHILPISLSVLGGQHLGGAEVEQAMRFLRRACRKPVEFTIQQHILPMLEQQNTVKADIHPVPGFGSHFGDIDPLVNQMARHLQCLPASSKCLTWGMTFTSEIATYNIGWLMTGLAAAVFADLGFQPRAGAGLYQLLCAPGLLAHGLEYANKPLSAVPFVGDEQYQFESEDG